jgi:hypothetical protein
MVACKKKTRILMMFTSSKESMFPHSTQKLHFQQNRTWFKDAGEGDMDRLLESHSLPLADEELAKLDKQRYEQTKGDEDDRGGVILDESMSVKF